MSAENADLMKIKKNLPETYTYMMIAFQKFDTSPT